MAVALDGVTIAVAIALENWRINQDGFEGLLMLVAAFAGAGDEGRRMVLATYGHAVREGYRFYSYGDCMLVL